MFAISLGDDRAEPHPLEVWQAEEFLAPMDRARELVDSWRQNHLHRGVRHDSEIRSVLAPEWRARTGR
ncbi:hypothetical protein [Streptomyces anulatus]|uniref:hypothetical protein n=1 Tax=Streptomyces anulatus TaxID=1892 RepID=UPI001C26903D|nr:hypothetical protein [Streptomyces anulatus]